MDTSETKTSDETKRPEESNQVGDREGMVAIIQTDPFLSPQNEANLYELETKEAYTDFEAAYEGIRRSSSYLGSVDEAHRKEMEESVAAHALRSNPYQVFLTTPVFDVKSEGGRLAFARAFHLACKARTKTQKAPLELLSEPRLDGSVEDQVNAIRFALSHASISIHKWSTYRKTKDLVGFALIVATSTKNFSALGVAMHSMDRAKSNKGLFYYLMANGWSGSSNAYTTWSGMWLINPFREATNGWDYALGLAHDDYTWTFLQEPTFRTPDHFLQAIRHHPSILAHLKKDDPLITMCPDLVQRLIVKSNAYHPAFPIIKSLIDLKLYSFPRSYFSTLLARGEVDRSLERKIKTYWSLAHETDKNVVRDFVARHRTPPLPRA